MTKSKLPTQHHASVSQFLDAVRKLPAKSEQEGRGRLIFAMDATASRQPMWDLASHLHAEMFEQVAKVGALQVQLAYYRGYGEFRASPWTREASSLRQHICAVQCLAGRTQIARVLQHALREHEKNRLAALVFVGDSVEESVDLLGDLAGKMGIHGIRGFFFQEGGHPRVTQAFEHMAKLSGGAHCQFDAHSAQQLAELLAAVAVYAAGGRAALQTHRLAGRSGVTALLAQLKS